MSKKGRERGIGKQESVEGKGKKEGERERCWRDGEKRRERGNVEEGH